MHVQLVGYKLVTKDHTDNTVKEEQVKFQGDSSEGILLAIADYWNTLEGITGHLELWPIIAPTTPTGETNGNHEEKGN